MIKNKNVLIDMLNTESGVYKKIPFESYSLDKRNTLDQLNNSNVDLNYNGKMTFNGANGLVLNRVGYIDLMTSNYYIEFDFSISSASGDPDGLQTLWTIIYGDNSPNIQMVISQSKKYIALFQFDTTSSIHSPHYIRYDFALNTTYNVKLIKYSTDGLSIFIDNVLRYRTNKYNVSTTGRVYPLINNYSGSFLRIGQRASYSQTINFKGEISNFRIIETVGDYDGSSFEVNSDKLIHHLQLESFSNFDSGWATYNPVVNINLGNNPYNATISMMTPSSFPFANLSDGELFWFKPNAGFATPTVFSDNVLKDYVKCTISFRMKTNSTVPAGTVIDCRSAVGAFNGILVTIGPTYNLILQISNISNTAGWAYTFATPNGAVLPNTEYKLQVVKINGRVMLYANGALVFDQFVDAENINWVSNKITFFNNCEGSNPSTHYFKDLRMYSDIMLANPVIDPSKIISLNVDKVDPILAEIGMSDNSSYIGPSNFTSIYNGVVYTPEYIDVKNTMTMESIIYKTYLLFVEGQPDYSIDLYKDDRLIVENFQYEEITIAETKKYMYHYIIKNTGVKKVIEESMIIGFIEVNVNTSECEGSELFVRISNTHTGEFIGDYELLDGYVYVDQLDCNKFYDATIIDKNKLIENVTRSKIKPKMSSDYYNRLPIASIRELNYYEAVTYHGKSTVDAAIAVDPNMSYYALDVVNTSTEVTGFNIIDYEGNLVAQGLNQPIIRVAEFIFFEDAIIRLKNSSGILIGSVIRIDEEFMYVVDIDGEYFTVNRGILDSSPSTHVTDSIVSPIENSIYIPGYAENFDGEILSVGKATSLRGQGKQIMLYDGGGRASYGSKIIGVRFNDSYNTDTLDMYTEEDQNISIKFKVGPSDLTSSWFDLDGPSIEEPVNIEITALNEEGEAPYIHYRNEVSPPYTYTLSSDGGLAAITILIYSPGTYAGFTKTIKIIQKGSR